MKVKSDHRSKFPIKQLERRSLKKIQGFNGIRTRDLRDTGAMLYNWAMKPHIGSEVNFIDLAPNVWLHSSVGRASHRYRGGHGFESRWSPEFFQASSFQLLKWKFTAMITLHFHIFFIVIFLKSSRASDWISFSPNYKDGALQYFPGSALTQFLLLCMLVSLCGTDIRLFAFDSCSFCSLARFDRWLFNPFVYP